MDHLAGLYVPQLRDDAWDLAAACTAIEQATTVPARRWCDFARAVIDGLAAEQVWRHPPTTFADGPDDTAPTLC